MKVLIFGLGLNGGGFEAATYFLKRKYEVRITDLKSKSSFGKVISKLESLGASFILGEHREEDFLWADIVVKNTVILPSNKYLLLAKEIITDFSFLFDNYRLINTKLIIITGTKGKTTTTSFITHTLKHIGYKVKMCGNMGISAFRIARYLDDYDKQLNYLVCEFSSWQLRDLKLYMNLEMPFIEVAAITNIMEDHQNTYENMNHYISDKLFLFNHKINYALCPKTLMAQIKKTSVLKRRKIIDINSGKYEKIGTQLELIPAFNVLKTQKINEKTIYETIKTYKGVPHRIQWIGTIHHVSFVNDSAATISEAVQFSFFHFTYFGVNLICGGTDKNLKANGMIEALKESNSLTLLDGSFTQNKLIPLLKELGLSYNGPFTSMRKATRCAFKIAKEKYEDTKVEQIVLLSPGASSFDLFINEFDRGTKFRESFRAIRGKIDI
ncbi:MAG: UDP-N-acetylmuramoylalanine--D-glutamate ligase [Spirochaetaceae bacterium]|nr:UDP-N-acetylmuramoylalanine--D-glutamate ligase [Spirochaetaceae bacterium]